MGNETENVIFLVMIYENYGPIFLGLVVGMIFFFFFFQLIQIVHLGIIWWGIISHVIIPFRSPSRCFGVRLRKHTRTIVRSRKGIDK